MDRIGEALIKLIEKGEPIAKDAAWWFFTIRLIDTVLAYACWGLFLGTVLYVAMQSMARWKEFADRRERR